MTLDELFERYSVIPHWRSLPHTSREVLIDVLRHLEPYLPTVRQIEEDWKSFAEDYHTLVTTNQIHPESIKLLMERALDILIRTSTVQAVVEHAAASTEYQILQASPTKHSTLKDRTAESELHSSPIRLMADTLRRISDVIQRTLIPTLRDQYRSEPVGYTYRAPEILTPIDESEEELL
jgi:hypothetical protein